MTDDKKIIKEQLQRLAERIQIEGERIPNEPLVTEYDNGGGQIGTHENPFYPAYQKLLACYLKTLAAAKEMCESEDEEISTLDSLRARFKVS